MLVLKWIHVGKRGPGRHAIDIDLGLQEYSSINTWGPFTNMSQIQS